MDLDEKDVRAGARLGPTYLHNKVSSQKKAALFDFLHLILLGCSSVPSCMKGEI